MRRIIGLIPAGGHASRLSPLPCSKELYPIGVRSTDEGTPRVTVVSQHLLRSMRSAGAQTAFVVLRDGKWDIPAYYKDGTALLDMHLAYLVTRLPYGPPFTIDQAYPFVRDATVAFGFPDILFEPADAFSRLLDRQAQTGADVVLGVWAVREGVADDRLVIDGDGRVEHVAVMSRRADLPLTWVIATWSPAFTEFMHAHLARAMSAREQVFAAAEPAPPETIMGHVMAAAVDENLHVDTVCFPDGTYVDLGTPEELTQIYSANLSRFT